MFELKCSLNQKTCHCHASTITQQIPPTCNAYVYQQKTCVNVPVPLVSKVTVFSDMITLYLLCVCTDKRLHITSTTSNKTKRDRTKSSIGSLSNRRSSNDDKDESSNNDVLDNSNISLFRVTN